MGTTLTCEMPSPLHVTVGGDGHTVPRPSSLISIHYGFLRKGLMAGHTAPLNLQLALEQRCEKVRKRRSTVNVRANTRVNGASSQPGLLACLPAAASPLVTNGFGFAVVSPETPTASKFYAHPYSFARPDSGT